MNVLKNLATFIGAKKASNYFRVNEYEKYYSVEVRYNKAAPDNKEYAEKIAKSVNEYLVSLLKDGNELSGSDVEQEHSDLHDVKICNAERDNSKESPTSVELPLRSITDVKEFIQKLTANQIDIPEDIQKVIKDKYWDIL